MLRRSAIALAFAFLLTASTASAAEIEKSPLQIPSEGMLPTLPLMAWIDVDYHAYDAARPQVGDIVIAHPPRSYSDYGDDTKCGVRVRRDQMCPRGVQGLDGARIVKRVVGVGGDRLAMRRGVLVRNGLPVAEPYTRRCPPSVCDRPRTITVPRGHVYLMGDNRPASDDSRFWGAVPARAAIARVTACSPPPTETCGPVG